MHSFSCSESFCYQVRLALVNPEAIGRLYQTWSELGGRAVCFLSACSTEMYYLLWDLSGAWQEMQPYQLLLMRSPFDLANSLSCVMRQASSLSNSL